ncbi:amino acid adenylation domain-containing protein [Streptomyces sp. NPDC054784]
MSAPAITDVLPLTALQEGLLFHALAERERRDLYVAQYTVPLRGPLDDGRLHDAVRHVWERHPNLRARIHHRANGQPVQVIPHATEPPWTVTGPGDTALHAARTGGIDVERGTLLRFDLVHDGGDRHRFAVTAHHCVLDGWSASVLLREVFTRYAGGELPPPVPYRRFLTWTAAQDRAAATAAWRTELAEAPPTLLAGGPSGATSRIGVVTGTLPADATAALRATARDLGVTLNTALQAAWALVLAQRTGHDDVSFGSVLSGRPAEVDGVHEMVGMLVNTVPVRVRTGDSATMADLLADVHGRRLAMLAHDHLGLGDATRAAGLDGDLFDTTVTVDNFASHPAPDGWPGQPVIGEAACEETAHYPVTVVAAPGERLTVRVHHDTGRVGAPLAQALLDQLLRVLDVTARAPRTPLADIQPCAPAERERLLAAGAGERPAPPVSPCVHEVFAARAARNPDATALVFEGARTSYAELDAAANRLAHQLLASGTGRGDWVGIRLERGPRLVVALLGVLKTGAGYVLLDPAFPAARTAECIGLTGCRTVVTDASLPDLPPYTGGPAPRVVCLDGLAAEIARRPATDPGAESDGEDPVCVMFTSGSQGRPKGVAAPHRAVVGSLLGQEWARVTERDVVLQCSPMSWDAFAFELLAPLFAGAVCVLQPGPVPEPSHIARLMAEHGVTVAHFSASLLNFLADEHPALFERTRLLLTGGEIASAGHLAALLARNPELRLVNAYSPLECMMVTVWRQVTPEDCAAGAVPLGGPVADKRLYILDEKLRLVPPGVVGELYLGGVGLAHGYLGPARLTVERFVADPYAAPGDRMYRTGDLARWTADGVVDFVGRSDDQLKLRGFRIEPAEVESALAGHPLVSAARVVVRTEGPGDRRLVAYVVPGEDVTGGDASGASGGGSDARALPEELRRHAESVLPEHLRPAAYVSVDRFPFTRNGKLDRDRLPRPEYAGGARGDGAQADGAPRDAREERLCALFASVLGCERVGVHDGFFQLGGHSLLALRLLARIQAEFGAEIRLRTLLRHPSVAELSPRLPEPVPAD